MDKFYDIAGAAEALEKSAAKNDEVEDRRLASLMKVPQWQSKFKVKRFEAPQTLRLVHTHGSEEAAEEAVFLVQGVLSSKNLPPVADKIRTTTQARYLRQGVSLLGCGTPTFEEALDAAQEIYGIFDRNVEDASLESWTLTAAATTGGRTLEASNRYLTAQRDAPGMVSVPIPTSIDPRGILAKLTKEGFIYGEENEVQFYQVHTNAEGMKRIEPAAPHVFRIGDIVEIQVSFMIVPLKDNKHKMIVVLRSIALLDPHFSQEALKYRMRAPEQIQPATLKRRVGYGEYIDAEEEQMLIDQHVDRRQKEAQV